MEWDEGVRNEVRPRHSHLSNALSLNLASMSEKLRIGLLGSGSWATALAKMICENTSNLNWWIRSEDMLENLKKFGSNLRYIESIQFPVEKLKLSRNMQEVIDNSDVLEHLASIFESHVALILSLSSLRKLFRVVYLSNSLGLLISKE